jgi:thioesterase domain-containing protein
VARKVEGAARARDRARGDAALSTAAFLNELLSRDIRVSAYGERLRCSAPPGALTSELREEIGRRKAEILEFLRTVEGIARQPDGIVPMQPRGTRLPIYAVSGHNGDVFAFRDLARRLGDDQPFYGLQAPGLDGQSEPLARVEDVASYLAAQVRAFQPEGAFVIAGYCAGGGIAFELARQLARAGAEPALLALFGCAHPSVYRFNFNLRYWTGRIWLHLRNAVRLRSPRDSWEYLTARVRERVKWLRAERTPPAADPESIARLHFEQATLGAVRRYTPGPYAGRVCHFLPKKGWLPADGGAARWHRAAPRTEDYYGPDSVEAERMLLDPDAAVFAELFRRCCDASPTRAPSARATSGPSFTAKLREAKLLTQIALYPPQVIWRQAETYKARWARHRAERQ